LKAQEQRSSAANLDSSALSGPVFGRRDSATRASSRSPGGKGVSSHRRGRLTVLAFAVAALALLAYAPVSSAKVVVNGYGRLTGTLGGEFGNSGAPEQSSYVHGVAVNNSGAGGVARGTFYVAHTAGSTADPGRPARVQRFSPTGVFQRAWGQDVIQSGRPGDISTTAFEICTVAPDCKLADGSDTTSNGGQLRGRPNRPAQLAVSPVNGHVYVADLTNRRISEFDADGNFIRLWGWDVVMSGRPGDLGADAFEICTVMVDCKQAGSAGADGGRFGGFESPDALIADASGNIWASDPDNRRIQQFDASGNFIAVYGYDVDALGGGGALERCTSTVVGACQAGTEGTDPGKFSHGPHGIAFDSGGNLYAIDPDNRRVQKFDPTLLASVSDFGTASLAHFTSNAPEHVLALMGGNRLAFVVNNAGVGERQIVELDPADASVEDTSLVGSGFNDNLSALAVEETTGNVYATIGFSSGSYSGSNVPKSPRPILVLGATLPPDPVLTIDPVTVKADTTATFSGMVDPTGGIVTCAFQYSTGPAFAPSETSSVLTPGCDSLASSGAQAVSANATGLIPNTHYFVRLAASRPLVPNSTTTSSATEFDTDSVPPAVSNVGAVEIADTSARLVGTIDPKHAATSYVFEYGTTPALGSSTPPVDIGNGTAPLIVSQVIEDLSPATTYHFRLVATNDFGSASSSNRTFLTRTDPVLPDARAYEMVSPVDKNGGGALSGGQAGWSVAYDGEAVGFCTTSMFGNPSSPLTNIFDACAHYASRRGADGWQTRSVIPPICNAGFNGGHSLIWYSRNVDYLVTSRPEPDCPLPPLDPAAQFGRNLYREDLLSTPSAFDLLGPQSVPVPVSDTAYTGSSYDFSHVVYRSIAQQTPDAPAGSFDKLYEWDNGTLRLISISPAGTAFTTASTVAGSGRSVDSNEGEGPADPDNGVSSTGHRIFLQNRGGSFVPEELYMREGGTVTHWVSQAECTVSCPGGFDTAARTFRYATPDGSRAFFTVRRKLADDNTNAVGEDLYMYRHSVNPASDKNLATLSIDSEPADGTTAGVLGVVGASDDGEAVYFVANGQLVLGGPTAAGPKLYRWRWNGNDPRLNYLATLIPGDPFGVPVPGDIHNWLGGARALRSVTPDGQYLLILTALALDSVADTDSSRDFYRWDARSGWLCVSCQQPGVASIGDAEGRRIGRTSEARRKITMSDDGRRIFFATPDALVPEDTNGDVGCPTPSGAGVAAIQAVPTCLDVYEWHDGKISLVSTGTSPSPSFLLGATHDGEDIFFYTEERLVGWDTDIVGDIYNARIGGGFPEPPPAPVPCDLNAGACEDAPSVAPLVTGAGSAAFRGPGNEQSKPTPRRCPRGKRKVSRNGRARCVARRKRRHAQRENRSANHNRRAAR
jgi:hypothetical protein